MKKININLQNSQPISSFKTQFQPTNIIFFNLDEKDNQSFFSFSLATIDPKSRQLTQNKTISFDLSDEIKIKEFNDQISQIKNPIFVGFNIDKNIENKLSKIINDFENHLIYDPSTIFTKQISLKELAAVSGFSIYSDNDNLKTQSTSNLDTLKNWFARVGINQLFLKIELFNSFFSANQQDIKTFLRNSNIKTIPQILKFEQTLEQTEKITPLTFQYQPHETLLKEMNKIREEVKTIQTQIQQSSSSSEKAFLEKQLLSCQNLINAWDSLLNFNFVDKTAKSKSKNVFYKMLWKYNQTKQKIKEQPFSSAQTETLQNLLSHWNTIINNFFSTTKKEINIDQFLSQQSQLKNKTPLNEFEKIQLNILNNIVENWNVVYQPHSWSSNFKFYGLDVSLGEGGVHASNNGKTFETETISIDVASYYPNEIINRLPNLIQNFEANSNSLSEKKYYKNYLKSLEEYSQLLKKRLVLKSENDPKQIVYKLIINQLYGLIGATFSPFYNNRFAFTICFNGQFQLLLLVHWLEKQQIIKNWVQLNTDGIHFELIDQTPETLQKYHSIIEHWEKTFNFKLEETKFKKFFNFNINNFIGQTQDGKIKTKGAFLKDYNLDLTKNGLDAQATASDLNIVGKMLTNWFLENKTFSETIQENPQLWKYQTIVKTSNFQDKILIQYPEQQIDIKTLNQPILEDLMVQPEQPVAPFKFIDNDLARCFFSNQEQKIFRFKVDSEFAQCDENTIKSKIFGSDYQNIYKNAVIDRDPEFQKALIEQINKFQKKGLIANLSDKKVSALAGPSYRQIKASNFQFDSENIKFYDFFINTNYPFDIKKILTKQTINDQKNNMFLIENPSNPEFASLNENLQSFNRLSNKDIEIKNDDILSTTINDFSNLNLNQYYQFAIDVLKSYKEFDFEEFLKSKKITIDQMIAPTKKKSFNIQIPKNRF